VGINLCIVNCIRQPVIKELDQKSSMCASFADLLQESVSWSKSLVGLDLTCVVVHEKCVNIKTAIIMVATIINCSSAMLAAKSTD